MVLLLFNALNGEFAKSFASPGNNSVFCQQRPLQNYSDLQNCNCGHKSSAQRLETKPSGTVPKMSSELIIQDKSINVKDSTYNFSMILCSCLWDLGPAKLLSSYFWIISDLCVTKFWNKTKYLWYSLLPLFSKKWKTFWFCCKIMFLLRHLWQ